ncbi:TIGR01777 family oxidoreductase [Saccharicrinis fermentans]|uniref:Epimerase family protein n=1 Tax=Saccharicrinis fermentans DSM 9555 = JCM 21142 TaxID=869213 RepID=W7YD22_9BACT|nr:TIGR01777 family oxidoreductase [Saccharicrinis fermentans]GAF02361.1 epimerase family protein [Saccharicrinis fermentans DSM 9555 = JCM 21142]
MKICLTGGTGFLGSRISLFFKENGFEVVNITRQDFKESPNAIANIIEGADMLINLAGAPIFKKWTSRYKRIIHDSRVHTTQKLVEAVGLVNHKPAIVLSCSAVGIYDDIYEHDEFSDRFGNDFLASVCKEWEAALVPLLSMDIKLAVMRIGVVLDHKQGALAKMLPSFKMGLGAVVGNGLQPFPCIHINDFLSAIWYILKNPESNGVYNLVAPDIVSNRYFSKKLGEKLKRPVFMKASASMMKLVLGDGASVLTKGQKVKPQRLLDLNFPFQFPTVDDMLNDLVSK